MCSQLRNLYNKVMVFQTSRWEIVFRSKCFVHSTGLGNCSQSYFQATLFFISNPFQWFDISEHEKKHIGTTKYHINRNVAEVLQPIVIGFGIPRSVF